MDTERHVYFSSLVDSYELAALLDRLAPADATLLRGVFARWNASAERVEQQLATARQLLQEELPYEERTSGYHAEEWTARVRAFLAGKEPNDER